jgi:hypothetical protein
VEEVIVVRAGTYYAEDLFLANPGDVWEGEFESVSGHAFDVYIIRSTDMLSYPEGNFADLVETENTTYTAFDFVPPDRFTAYRLIIDNLDNGHPFDANAGASVTVRMARTAPLRSNPQAQEVLGSLTGVCAAALVITAVVVAIYLKVRRPPRDEDESSLPPRVEIQVDVPKRPRGAWAAAEREEAPGDGSGAQAQAAARGEDAGEERP